MLVLVVEAWLELVELTTRLSSEADICSKADESDGC